KICGLMARELLRCDSPRTNTRSGCGLQIDAATGDPVFAYKPSLAGAPCRFWLRPDALEWRTGWRHGRAAYADIRRVRLSFAQVDLNTDRFLAEVWPASGARVVVASTSWRSITEQETLGRAYRGFIAELHRRIVAANGCGAAFEAGLPPWRYRLGVTVLLATSLALVGLIARALRSGDMVGALFVAGFLAVLLWRFGTYLSRNRSGTYRPDAPPGRLMP
ncbi:MAG TPA: hypothetical protein VK281_18895, partial [Xanthobacteraceae bacterium]|nr:hypothetical protein [Xanthobacteraceae bacterium]